ncbi:MAG: rRNA maturation RNase YbeY [Bacteroidales bacterium]|nr:rRNA maturation RNase YbeY [Bacteroidales bacterium]
MPILKKEAINKILLLIISDKEFELDYINIIFCSDEYLLNINKEYLSHDYFTDIITFDYSETTISSDIFISLDRIKENSNELKISYKSELYRVIIHGVLHLVGYDDTSDIEKKEMTSMEDFYLDKLQPYLS